MRILAIDPGSTDVPRRAVQILLDGGLVAFPTDTYYALGAAAGNAAAIARVFAVKRRPPGSALPVLVADREQWRALTAEIPDAALLLAGRFWPGALTIICRGAPHLPAVLTGGRDAVGARQPACPAAIGLCRAAGTPVVGTSANVHGHPAPVTAIEVALDLGAAVDLILDGGPCPVARPSTVVDVTVTPPRIVRAGAISEAAVSGALAGAAPVGP